MKKWIFIVVFAFGLMNVGNSQTTEPQNAKWQQITLAFGSSVPGLLANGFSRSSYVNSSFATPVMNLSYAYLFQDNISVGAVVSYQNIYLDLLPLSNSSSSGISFNLNRLNLSLHTEYYVVQKNKIDLYLGGKLGVNAWWGKVSFNELRDYLDQIIPFQFIVDAINKELIPSNENFHSLRISYQFTAGADYFFTQNIGLKGELAFGSPYWLNLGLNVRF